MNFSVLHFQYLYQKEYHVTTHSNDLLPCCSSFTRASFCKYSTVFHRFNQSYNFGSGQTTFNRLHLIACVATCFVCNYLFLQKQSASNYLILVYHRIDHFGIGVVLHWCNHNEYTRRFHSHWFWFDCVVAFFPTNGHERCQKRQEIDRFDGSFALIRY